MSRQARNKIHKTSTYTFINKPGPGTINIARGSFQQESHKEIFLAETAQVATCAPGTRTACKRWAGGVCTKRVCVISLPDALSDPSILPTPLPTAPGALCPVGLCVSKCVNSTIKRFNQGGLGGFASSHGSCDPSHQSCDPLTCHHLTASHCMTRASNASSCQDHTKSN